ncbi:DUF2325 domain-containing protein [Brevibacillus laterosporus]|uniref:DUF2325 domain-containing protein n=1 Tax=Brevibacillus laterosporus TaxID=1465 RepID=UPI0018CFB0D0
MRRTPNFKKKRILKAHYKEKIESRGGIFLSVDDKDSITSIEACVKKADVVILLLARLGHILMKQVKKLCKEWNVPFETTFNIGADKITQIVSEALISRGSTSIADTTSKVDVEN